MGEISTLESEGILEPFKTGRVPDAEYQTIRQWSARSCHDAVIYVPEQKKILLAIRQQEPAKGRVWPFGGGQKRGLPLETSLIRLIKGESGLDLDPSAIEFFGKPTDHYWSTSPDGFPVHEVGNYYLVEGHGNIKPNELHRTKLIGGEEYMDTRNTYSHWTNVGMDRAVEKFFGLKVMDKTPFPDFYINGVPYRLKNGKG